MKDGTSILLCVRGHVSLIRLRGVVDRFHIGLPNSAQRVSIFQAVLRSEVLADDIDFAQLSDWTVTYSGSDIKEVCRAAVMNTLPVETGSIESAEVCGY